MAAKDELVAQLDVAQIKWAQSDEETRKELLRPFATASGLTTFSKIRFERLPEILQLMLSLHLVDNTFLNDIAIREGYLDYDTRSFVNRNIVVAAIAGSINRGSTATETSAYRRTGNAHWTKKED